MRAYRIEATVPQSGELQLDLRFFQPGDVVEIIVLALADATDEASLSIKETSSKVNGHQLPNGTELLVTQQRQAVLAAIQRGKYAVTSLPGVLWPSEVFAASKTEEKLEEERRWQ